MLATAGGDVVASQSFEIPNSKEYLMKIMPTMSMVGKANILVFYITECGEIISDSQQIELIKKMNNEINIELSKPVAKPGEMLEISKNSNPGSFVGLVGVEQSVLILKKENDFDQSEVLNELEKYNEIEHNAANTLINKNSFYEDFESAGFVIITNIEKPGKIFKLEEKLLILYLLTVFQLLPKQRQLGKIFLFSKSKLSILFLITVRLPVGLPVQLPVKRRKQLLAQYDSSFGSAAEPQSSSSADFSIETTQLHPMRAARARTFLFNSVQTIQPSKPIEIGKTFPETWIFESFDFDDT